MGRSGSGWQVRRTYSRQGDGLLTVSWTQPLQPPPTPKAEGAVYSFDLQTCFYSGCEASPLDQIRAGSHPSSLSHRAVSAAAAAAEAHFRSEDSKARPAGAQSDSIPRIP